MLNQIPRFIKPFLWSYDIDRLDLATNKNRIILNVLNLGDKRAVDWLFSTYPRAEIAAVIAQAKPGEWSKKSLNFWSLMFDLSPNRATSSRFLT